MLLAHRPPSVNWEPLPLDPAARAAAWVWFRPAINPYGILFVIPPELFSEPISLKNLSLRQLILATGLVGERVLYWSLNGLNFENTGGNSPLMDQPLPITPGNPVNLSVWIEPLPALQTDAAASMFAGQPSLPSGYAPAIAAAGGMAAGSMAAGATDVDLQMIDGIESCWNGIIQLEVRIGSIRKELAGNISRLNSLNRDLNSDERRTCDSKDIQAWVEARRWLRDSISTLSRSVKEIDVGTTSGAGQRHKFLEIYQKYIVPRIPFAGLRQSLNEFEAHRKTVQNVLASAQANIARSGREAEQRANAVLARISTKMRSIRRKD